MTNADLHFGNGVHVIMLECCLIEGNEDSVKTLETLNQRVKRQENLLQRCKESIRSHKERCAQLTNEKDALQEQLEERLQELEKMKVWKVLSALLGNHENNNSSISKIF